MHDHTTQLYLGKQYRLLTARQCSFTLTITQSAGFTSVLGIRVER